MKLKIFLLGTIFFAFFSVFFDTAGAADTFFGKAFTEIKVQEDGSAIVTASVPIKNSSAQNIIDSLNLEIPLQFTDFTAVVGGVPQASEVNKNFVTISLHSNPIKPGTATTLNISYKLSNLYKADAAIKNIYLPKFTITFGSNDNLLRILLPRSLGELVYVSRTSESTTVTENNYEINYNTLDEVYLSLSNYHAIRFNTSWKVINGKSNSIKVKMPLPGRDYNPFVFSEIKGFKEGFRDNNLNEFVLLDAGPDDTPTAGYSGTLIKVAYDFPRDTTTGGVYYSGIAQMQSSSGSSRQEIYRFVQNSLHPVFSENNWERKSPEDLINANQHTSLDYSTLLAALYRQQGIPAHVAYGLVHLPQSTKYVWHFWVVYFAEETGGNDSTGIPRATLAAGSPEGSWHEQDPFFQDYLNFSSEESVTPDRVPFGILDNEENTALMGFIYLENADTAVTFLQNPQDLPGMKTDYQVSLENLSQAYSAHSLDLRLFLNNNSNHSIYLDKVQIEDVVLQDKSVHAFMLLPESNKLLQIPGVIVGNPFYQGVAKISGNINVQYAGKTESNPVDTSVLLDIDYGFIFLSILVLLITIALVFRWLIFVFRRLRRRAY